MKVGDLVKFVPYEGNYFSKDKDRGVGIITEAELINDYTGATRYIVRWTKWADTTRWHWICKSYLEVINESG